MSANNPTFQAMEPDPAALSRTIAAIHAGIFDRAFPEFRTRTLEVIRPDLPFDIAVWGSGMFSTKTMLSASPVGLDAEAVLEYASQWQGPDLLRDATAANPGRALRYEDIMSFEAYRASPFYREYLRPNGIEHVLGIVQRDDVTDLAEVIFLLRSEASPPFSVQNAGLLELLTPHLCAAWRHRQISHHREEAHRSGEPGFRAIEGFAVTDSSGLAHAIGDAFCIALREVAPDWRGPYLPAVLTPLLEGAASSLTIGEHLFSVRPASGMLLLAGARASAKGGLTPAETRVARLYSEGRTHRQIAEHLGVSQSTVRHQIASAYRKLDIHSKAELARYALLAPGKP